MIIRRGSELEYSVDRSACSPIRRGGDDDVIDFDSLSPFSLSFFRELKTLDQAFEGLKRLPRLCEDLQRTVTSSYSDLLRQIFAI